MLGGGWIFFALYLGRSRCSIVGVATRLRTGWSSVWIPVGLKDFSLLQNVQTGHGAHTTSYSMDAGFLPGREHPGLEVTHLPPSSGEVKNGVCHISAVHMPSWPGQGKGKRCWSVSCLKGNKWSVTTPCTYSFSSSSSAAPPAPTPLLPYVSSYFFICSVVCFILLQILHWFLDIVLKYQQICPDNLCTKCLHIITF